MSGVLKKASIRALTAYILTGFSLGAEAGLVREYQERLKDLGRVRISLEMEPGGPAWAPFTKILDPLLLAPRKPILDAVYDSIRTGGVEEQIGALEVYMRFEGMKEVKPDPGLRQRISELLKNDNLEIPAYTNTLAAALAMYPSTETAVQIMEIALREQDPRMKAILIDSTAADMGIYLGLATNKAPTENARLLSEFEVWFHQNKDRIVIKQWGKFRLTGQESAKKVVQLSEADRARIRSNPGCVIRLKDVMLGADDQGQSSQLLEQCGEALFGSETATLLRRVDKEGKTGKPPGLQLKAEISAAEAAYPWRDAAILAAAYVLAYEKNSSAREAAKETLFYCTSKDAKRITQGEAPEVRKMAKEFAQGDRSPWNG